MTTKSRPEPFTDATYLDAEIEFLRVRLSRIDTQRRLSHAERATTESADGSHGRGPGIPALRGTLHELVHQERQSREDIDGQLEARRASPAEPLGIDRLCDDHDLGPEERLLLVSLCVPAVSKELVEDALNDQRGFCGHLSIGELCRVLDPTGVADHLRVRRLWRPGSPLVKHGLVIVDTYSPPTAGTLMDATVELSLKSFGVIFNDQDALSEVQPDPEE